MSHVTHSTRQRTLQPWRHPHTHHDVWEPHYNIMEHTATRYTTHRHMNESCHTQYTTTVATTAAAHVETHESCHATHTHE